jgi:hypothetical protein
VLLLYDFEACVLQLQVGAGVGDEWLDLLNPAAVQEGRAGSHTSHAGGQGTGGTGRPAAVRTLALQLEGPAYVPLELQVFVDGSVVEVFTGDGQVMSTRAYRGLAYVYADANASSCSPGCGVVLCASAAAARQEDVAGAAASQPVAKAEVTIGAMRSIW